MLENQLSFNRTEEPNYFIYDNPQQKLLYRPNTFTDLQSTPLVPGAINENKQLQSAQPDQLGYKLQKDEGIFPIEKANPLYFNQAEQKVAYQLKVKAILSKAKTKMRIAPHRKRRLTQTKKKKAPFSLKQISNEKTFDLSTNVNSKGLFDPFLKQNELNSQSRTKKQLYDKAAQMRLYDSKSGQKVRQLQKYKNYLDVYEDLENAKSELDQRKSLLFDKLQSSNTKDLRSLLETIPKPNVKYTQCNLDFNFSKYEDTIKALEEQINYERRLREEDNRKYWQMIKEHKGVAIDNGNRLKEKNEGSRALKGKRAKSGRMRHVNRQMNEEERFKRQSRQFAKSVEKIIDRDVDLLCRDLSIKEAHIKRNAYFPTSNKRWRKGKRTKKNYSFTSPPKQQPRPQSFQKKQNIITQLNNQQPNTSTGIGNSNQLNQPQASGNSGHPFDNFSIENQIRNEVLEAEQRSKMDQINKFQLISSLNNSIDTYSKGFPIIMNQVTTVIDKIKEVNIFDDRTHPLIKMASKSAGHTISKHIEAITDLMINDLFIDLIIDLQSIEDCKLKQHDKASFVHFLSNYYGNIQHMRSYEETALQKALEAKSNLTSFKASNQLAQGKSLKDDICTQLEVVNRTIPRAYRTSISNERVKHCEKYKREFTEYLKLKGSFYYPNIYEIYDQVVNEETSRVLNEELLYCLKQMDEFVNDLYKEEVLNQVEH